MALLSMELLVKKLATWTASSKVADQLGFDDSQANEVKQELNALVEMGLVERQGERRGLKFRLINAANKVLDDNEDEQANFVEEAEDEVTVSKKHDEAASLREFFAAKKLAIDETEGKTPLQLMSAITDMPIRDSSILSHTLAYKRTADDNILVSFYIGCLKMYEKQYTLSAFNKVLKSELKALAKPIPA